MHGYVPSNQGRRDWNLALHHTAPSGPTVEPMALLPRASQALTRISRQLAVEAHDRPAITSFGLLAVLNVGFKNVGARHAVPEVAERRAPCTDGSLTHFAAPPGEECGLTK